MSGDPTAKQPLDDRGQPVKLNAVTRSGDAAPKQDPQLADLRMRAYVSAAPKRSVLKLAAIGMLMGLLGGSTALLSGWLGAGVPAWIMPALASGVMVSVFVYRSRRAVKRIAPRIIDAFLFEGRCPGCGYVMDGMQTEPDGCRVCPECGAAWKAERIGASVRTPEAIREYRRRLFNPTTRERWLPGVRMPMMWRDARDRAVSVTNPRLRHLDEATIERLGANCVREIQQNIGWRHRGRGVLLSLCMLPGFILFVRMVLTPGAGAGSLLGTLIAVGTFAFCALMVLLLGGFVVSLLFGDNGLSPRRVVREFLARRVCPQCLYRLDGAAPDAEGVVACPTCAAAWKLDQGTT